jgi:hypothetical protein
MFVRVTHKFLKITTLFIERETQINKTTKKEKGKLGCVLFVLCVVFVNCQMLATDL